MSISATVSASVSASFFKSFEATLGVEGSIGYNWADITSEAKNEVTELKVFHEVNPCECSCFVII